MRLLLHFIAFWIVTESMLFAEQELVRRLTLSSAYIEPFYNSNEGMVYFPLSAIQGYSKLFDLTTSDFSHSVGAKVATIALELPVSYWLANSLFVPFHEFGHARAYRAFGDPTVTYLSVSYGWLIQSDSFWGLSLLRLLTPPFGFPGGGPAAAQGAPEYLKNVKTIWDTNEVELIVVAAGLNNQSLLAKRLADLIYCRGGHFTYLQHYIGNKISGFVYSSLSEEVPLDSNAQAQTDPARIIDMYNKNGINITNNDIKMQSLLSLVSGTTFALFRGYYDYFTKDSAQVRPAEIYGFRIPEINSYINTRGLSLEIESDYQFSSWLTFGLAYEYIWKGKFTQQFSPRARYNLAHVAPALNEFWLSGDLVISNGLGGSLKTDYSPWPKNRRDFFKHLAFFANIDVFHAKTLYGERNFTSAKNNQLISSEIVFGTHLSY